MVIEIVDFPIKKMVDLSIVFCMSDFNGDIPLKSITGWWYAYPLKNMKVKWDYYSRYMEKR